MRNLLLLSFALLCSNLFSQINCHIYPGDTTVCYGSYDTLYTEYADTLNYLWEPSGETTVFIVVHVRDTTNIHLTVTNKDNTLICTDSVVISIFPKIEVTFEQINKGCPGECKAQVIATASGGIPPYHYKWAATAAPNDSSLALGLCDTSYKIRVRDTICSLDTSFLVKTYDMPEITVTQSPDSLFSVNPQAVFSFENKSADSIPLTNWVWKFTDGTATNESAPNHVFSRPPEAPDTVKFIYTTIDGCVDTMEIYTMIKEFKLTVPNVFTPNGDGANDHWEIPNIDRYISNQIVVYNRWGQRVFEFTNYKDQWDGGKLPDGVYFYLLTCKGYWSQDTFKGSVTIIGSGR
jgi:gliding motility-associated-like protein